MGVGTRTGIPNRTTYFGSKRVGQCVRSVFGSSRTTERRESGEFPFGHCIGKSKWRVYSKFQSVKKGSSDGRGIRFGGLYKKDLMTFLKDLHA